ncbi:pyrroline-5-carboxylate reductase [Agilicoccus flavus]|uniref:pyrroline-5-carboxylate reductase n=1 Tax=Agilicoccus flavus TaxID=2775968 RepID=UPI001CF6DC44|nr:pyrroline-5-carboxylate reductase [Agilicoccus flavus]
MSANPTAQPRDEGDASDPTSGPRLGDLTIALLGAGVMGSAVLDSILRAGADPAHARVTTLDEDAAARWHERGVTVAGNAEAVRGADVVVVAVKGADVAGLLDEVTDAIGADTLVVSLAAGIRVAALEEHLPSGVPVVRVMPNTPALVGEGMSALSPGTSCGEDHLGLARALLETCGQVVVVPEKQQDAVTALSGSGPAYVFALAEAMIDGGVLVGLPRPVATQLAVQTLVGAAAMLRDGDTPPGLLRERVTSPGGTTAAALREFDRGGLRSTILGGIEAARDKSVELGG